MQELVSEQDGAGLKEIFGRKPFVPRSHGDADHVIESYGGLEMLPVSAKSYWSEQYFRDHSLRLIERWRLDHNQVRPHSAHRGLPPAKACLLAAGARPGLVDGPAARPLAPSPITCYQPEGLPS